MKYMFILWICFLVLHKYANGQNWLKKFDDDVEKIKDYMNGKNKGKPYRRLAYTTDKYGPRLVASEGFEKSLNVIRVDSQNVSLVLKEEEVKVTFWKESHSKAELQSKFRNKRLSIVAYGPSEKSKDLTAQILLVKSFEELNERSSEVNGKIVVYNQECQDYVTCVKYRNNGASEAAKYGAVASLTRTVSFNSVNNLHTGPVTYIGKKIPAAAITVEDAAFIERILKHDPDANITLDINTKTEEDKISKNLIIEIPGTDLENEIILSGTHTDSWHVSDGVANNAVGITLLYESMRVIQSLGLKPKRTLRLALWTAGEQNAKGEKHFFDSQKKKNNEEIKLIMRSEKGFFDIGGLNIKYGKKINSPMKEILKKYFKEWNFVVELKHTESKNTAKWLENKKIPSMEFLTDMKRYLEVYNSGGDTLDKVNPDELDKVVTIWSTILYILGSADGTKLFN